jgi:hypothetical protein
MTQKLALAGKPAGASPNVIKENPALPVENGMAGLAGRTPPLAGVAAIQPRAH